MKIRSLFTTIIMVMLLSISLYNCGGSGSDKDKEKPNITTSKLSEVKLPDAKSTCVVEPDSFSKWFKDGKVTENGFVKPANSLTFKPENNCSFYRWSEQMFLWLTSQNNLSGNPAYGSRGIVLESPVFYTVSPSFKNGKETARDLTPHTPNDTKKPLKATSDIGKINTEEGQATNNVLLDRNGNIVYYITMVNDVYAALLEMAKQDTSKVNKFPTTPDELKRITAFAQKKGLPIIEPNTLAIELKTSWVELGGGVNKNDYITIQAIIPTYTKNDTIWKLTGESPEPVTLALVGMHIVGSAAGHPEMIWSTFEHKSNTPNAKYQYVNTSSKTKDVNPDDAGNWLFSKSKAPTSENESYASFSDDIIKATKGHTIAPSDTRRISAWGSAFGVQPNQEDTTTADANTQVIAINNSVIKQLVGNDVRKNYLFIGSTWTFGGLTPNGTRYEPKSKTDPTPKDSTSIGTSSLANSTMETDFQLVTLSCFTCHNRTLDPKIDIPRKVGLSHIFASLMKGKIVGKSDKK